MNDSKGRAEYNTVTKKVLIARGDIRIELPGEYDTLEDAKAAALQFVERLRAPMRSSTSSDNAVNPI